MKYLSFIIPCYNSEKYMRKCIDSVLHLGEKVEILIIDDGSNKDKTLKIAKEYQEKYPTICKAIHKKNGGHGDALNVGIKHAKGLFTKVIDSDDWLGKKESKILLDTIKRNYDNNKNVDLYITNYIYDKVGQRNKKVMSYKRSIPKNKVITWDDIKTFPVGTYMLMHALTYNTKVLKKAKLELPKKTFYVDNIYAYKPFPYVKKICYLDIDLYHYFIGRNDQSVNENVMISRIDQQYKVTKIMLYKVNLEKVKYDKLKKYMLNYMSIIMTVTSILSILSNDSYWLKEKDKLWNELRKKNPKLYRELMFSFLGIGVNLPGKLGKKLAKTVYEISRKIYGFN